MDVEQLVRAAQRGDPAAIDALLRALTPYVGRVCGAIALDRGDDAMQETFIVMLRNLRSVREPAAFQGWVRRIAVREAIRAARAGERTTPIDPADLAALAITPAAATGLGGSVGTAAAADHGLADAIDVRATLAALAPEHRAVLVLRDLDGFAEAEVAALLELPTGTVKSRLHRARTAFAHRWEA